jgi:hypothetical protein
VRTASRGGVCHDGFLKLISLFTSLLAIPLARQSCLDAFLLTGFQVVGVTLDFLDDVLLLYLPLEPAESIFQRLAFLYTNLCQKIPPPNPPIGFSYDTGKIGSGVKRGRLTLKNLSSSSEILAKLPSKTPPLPIRNRFSARTGLLLLPGAGSRPAGKRSPAVKSAPCRKIDLEALKS